MKPSPFSSEAPQTQALPRVWSVQALCLALNDALAARFNPVMVEGEIASWSKATSGHCYFTLKDTTALLRCALFRRNAQALHFVPKDGMQVQVHGRIGVYEARGDLQLVVESIQAIGEGALLERFLRLKTRLTQAGCFDVARKRDIPQSPRAIGVITSLGAAALHDVQQTLQRRAPHIPVLLAPASVQGKSALEELIASLALLQKDSTVDVILLVRGGGSMEDLWTFNEEALVYAVLQSKIPVVTGIGHETDFTLSDFAADVRAATPTAAAELAATPLAHWQEMLQTLASDWEHRLISLLQKKALELDYLAERLQRPTHWLSTHTNGLALLRLALQQGLQSHVQTQQAALQMHASQLQALSPCRVLDRGYALLRQSNGDVLHSVTATRIGSSVEAVLADGQLQLQVQATQTHDKPHKPTTSHFNPTIPKNTTNTQATPNTF